MRRAETIDQATRAPTALELERVLYLFGDIPLSPTARFLALTRNHPVERFIAAAAWWPEEKTAHFQLTCQPGVARSAVARWLIDGLAADAGRTEINSLQFAALLTEDNEWFEILQQHGFSCSHSERAFEISYGDAWQRVMRLHRKHCSRIPSGWRTVAIREHSPEIAIKLLTQHRLMPPAELRHYWNSGRNPGFDLDLSCILFDGEEPFGVFLTRRMRDGLYIDAQAVHETNPLLRSLGDLFMLYHSALRVPIDGPIRWIRFRSGQTEHRQTANLARRMGGRELARAHLLARKL